MQQPKPVKICLVGQSLAHGGAEKAMGLLSIFLESQGVEVYNVLVLDEVAYPFAGKLLNLGKLKGASNSVFDKARRFKVFYDFLRREKFDRIIDFRIRVSFWQEFFINRVLYDAPTFYTVHSSLLKWYFPMDKTKARKIYSKADGIVSVSDGIKSEIEKTFGLENVTVIPNAIDLEHIAQKAAEPIPFAEKFIVSAGRMDDDLKQFDKLIDAYYDSGLPDKDIHLVLLGDGKLKPQIMSKAGHHGHSRKVHFMGFVQNPYAWFAKAEFYVLSSRNEGLPMVILESLACGKPVVSFDCVSGPNEMVFSGKNGLLVEDQNFEKLTQSLDLMAFDKELYDRCKSNSVSSVQEFSIEKVGRRWLSYLKIA